MRWTIPFLFIGHLYEKSLIKKGDGECLNRNQAIRHLPYEVCSCLIKRQ